MSEVLQDFAFAWRNVRRRPATALLIIVTLALGIGANTAMFSMVHQVLLASPPYADGERLVTLKQSDTSSDVHDIPWMVPTVVDYRAQNTVFSDLLGYVQLEYTLLGRGAPHFALTGIVNADYFTTLGIAPLLGRGLSSADDEPGAPPVMLLGYEFWLSKFAADPAVLGSTLEMNDIVYTVVGVLPAIPPWPRRNDVWIPYAADANMSLPQLLNARGDSSSGIIWSVTGKLLPDVSIEQARRDVATITQRLKTEYPDVYPDGYSIALEYLQDELTADAGTTIVLLLALALLVLMIACANAANLNLAGLTARSQELAVREATGASPGRIRRQLLTESLLFALAGGALGLLLAWPLLKLLAVFAAGYTALAGEIRMNGSVLLLTLCIAVFTAVLSGAVPALMRRDINKALKEGGDKATSSAATKRGGHLLLVVQIGLAFVMLTSSGLILLSLHHLGKQDPGYATEQVTAVSLQLNQNYPMPSDALDFVARASARIRGIPGVEGVAVAGSPLLQTPLYGSRGVEIEGLADSRQQGSTYSTVITPDYHRVMSIPLLEGRVFTDADDADALPVVIINKNFADHYYPDGGAVGRRISFNEGQTWRTVIGVVANVRSFDLDKPEGAAVYTSLWQTPTSILNLFVKSTSSLDELERALTAVVHAIDPELAIEYVQPLEEARAAWLAPRQLVATLIGLFGLLALLVTLSGVVGVVSFNVSRRVREIGIHMATGATPGNIAGIFLREGLRVYLAGLTLGLLLMLLVLPFLEPLLYETSAGQTSVYLASAVVLTLAVLIATYLPARKASELSPMEALHCE